MKRIKRHDEYFTLLTPRQFETERTRVTELCQQCGAIEHCDAHELLKQCVSLDRPKMFSLKACEDFERKVFFKNPTGFTGRFNTLRLGDATDKYRVGDKLCLCDLEGNVVTRAEVLRLIVGNKQEIILEHCKRNHANKSFRGNREQCAEETLKRMRRHYHSHLWARQSLMTAIYMRPRK